MLMDYQGWSQDLRGMRDLMIIVSGHESLKKEWERPQPCYYLRSPEENQDQKTESSTSA